MSYISENPSIHLRVLIVGAGIGGLTAAIALRRQGHNVEARGNLFETTKGPSEVGAAINIAYNADSVLKKLGVNVAESGGVRMEQLRLLKASGEILKDDDYLAQSHRWQSDYRLTLRAALHSHLRKRATEQAGDGPPAHISFSSKIVSVDADSAAISFADGSSRQGDVVIGADGVHSVTRHQIAPDVQAKPSQHSAFRFLVREEEVLEDPRTRHLASSRNAMWVWYAGDRKMVLYRCENNELMNFVCIHPGHLSKVDAGSYNTPVDKSVPLDIFKDFEPGLRGMLEKADPNSLRVYPLFDMDTLPTYVKGKMALLGDAAHPFLPHLAQGGAMAIEDGVSLGVMLSNISSIEEVPARLQLYNDARYERDTLVQKYTRIVGGDGIEEGQDSPEKLSVNQYLQYPYSHDEHHASTAILLKYLWSKKPGLYWRQPVAFGPMPGPRQDFDGHPYAWDKVRSTTTKIVFQTSATLLRNLFPSEAYSFKSRDTVAIASLRIQSLGNLSWLGGQGYKLLSFHVHDVTYTAVDGKEYTGSYIPVVFENLADPIMTGREELGWPKVFSDLETHQDDDAFRASLSWRGTTWAEFSLPLVRASSNSASEAQPKTKQTESLLIHRQMPGVGDQTRVKADGAYASYYPGQEIRTKTLSEQHSPKPANISFKAHDWQKLPTLHHMVKGLEEIPILSVVESSIIEEEGSTDFRETTRIEV